MRGVGREEADAHACTGTPERRGRDVRVDLVRGLSLIMIFFDHIPYNCMSKVTLQMFGFCDAAELFVFIAGYSAVMAYTPLFATRGLVAGVRKVLSRCLSLWGAHGLLVLFTMVVLALRAALTGIQPTLLAPVMRDGMDGILRCLTLQTLPAYCDILPLYIVLLLWFPLIAVGLRSSVPLTVTISGLVYQVANASHYNLPNVIDARIAQSWSFNPFAWQLIYVIGAAYATGVRRRTSWLLAPPRLLRGAIMGYLVFSLIASDSWHLWPWLGDRLAPSDFLGNDPKAFATPWRVAHAVALMVLLLSSERLAALVRHPVFEPITACGRHSLPVFCATCVLALFGRIAFHDYGPGLSVQVAVNTLGIMALLALAATLDLRKTTLTAVATTTPIPLEA